MDRLLTAADRIKEERISSHRLATILRPKTEENYAAFAQAELDQRRLAFDEISAEEPAGQQRILVTRIPGDDLDEWHRHLARGVSHVSVHGRDARATDFKNG